MRLFLDVLDTDGNVLGEGPLENVSRWKWTRKLDAAGSISFTLPVTDSRLQMYAISPLFKVGRRVRMWGEMGGQRASLGEGTIRRVTVDDATYTLTAEGPDLLGELATRIIPDLDISTESAQAPGNVAQVWAGGGYTELVYAYDGDPGTYNNVTLSGADPFTALYVRGDWPFRRLDWLFSQFNSSGSAVNVQYFNGVGWQNVPGLVDTTIPSGQSYSFGQSGYIQWDYPEDWLPVKQNGNHGYWIRVWPPVAYDQVRVNEVTLTGKAPTTNALAQIMVYAPAGWSLDTDWFSTTQRPVILRLKGETVLAALVKIHELTGEHFRLADSGRKVAWLRSLGTAELQSGLLAVRALGTPAEEANGDICLIARLTERLDGYEIYNRIYPYGGNGTITLAETTGSAMFGYTLNAAANYLERDLAPGEERIEKRVDFAEIRVEADTQAARVQAANELLAVAQRTLLRHDTDQRHYDLSLAKVAKPLRPGEDLRVVCRTIAGGYRAFEVNGFFHVLEVTLDVDSRGVLTAHTQIASIDRFPMTDARLLAGQVKDARQLKMHGQPLAEEQLLQALTASDVLVRAMGVLSEAN
jgi:hypothetical protein